MSDGEAETFQQLDSGDLRQARQNFHRFKFKKLVEVLDLWNNESDSTRRLGKRFAEGKSWIGDFGASLTWARQIRIQFEKQPRRLKNSQNENFSKLLHYQLFNPGKLCTVLISRAASRAPVGAGPISDFRTMFQKSFFLVRLG